MNGIDWKAYQLARNIRQAKAAAAGNYHAVVALFDLVVETEAGERYPLECDLDAYRRYALDLYRAWITLRREYQRGLKRARRRARRKQRPLVMRAGGADAAL